MQEPTTVVPVYSHLEEATAVRTTRWNDLSGDYGAGIGHWAGQPYVDSLKGDGGLTWWGDVSIAGRVAVANPMVEPNAPIWGERLRRMVGFGSDWLGGSIQYGRMVLVPALCYEEGLLAWPTKVEIPYGTGPGGSQYLSYASDVALADPAEIPTRALTCAREDGTWDLRARVVQVDEFSLDPDDDEQLLAETSYGDLATLDTNTVFGGLHGWGDGMQALRLTRLATDRYLVVYLVDPLDGGSKAVTEWDGSNGDVSGHAVVRGITTSGTSITVGPAVSVASGVLTVDLARVDDERAVVSYGSANQNIFDGSQSNMESIPFGAFGWQSATPATVEVSWTFGGTIARTGSYGLGLRAVEAVTEMRANPVFTSPNSPAPRVVAGSSYTVEGWVRAASASRTVNIGIQWVGPTGTVLSEWLSGNFSDASGSWTRIYGTGVAPAGTAYAHPFVKVTGSIGADERHWFDDFSLLRSGAVGGHRVVSFNGTTIDIGPEYTQAALYAPVSVVVGVRGGLPPSV